MAKKSINWVAITTIIAFFSLISIIIINWEDFRTNIPNVISSKESFEVEISPSIIYQGTHNYNNPEKFQLTIFPNKELNITSIKISEDNFKIIRDVTGEQLSVIWKYNYGGYIFDSSRSSYYQTINKEFSAYGCDNCFFGENRDYILRMIIEYSIDGITQSPKVIEIKIDVV